MRTGVEKKTPYDIATAQMSCLFLLNTLAIDGPKALKNKGLALAFDAGQFDDLYDLALTGVEHYLAELPAEGAKNFICDQFAETYIAVTTAEAVEAKGLNHDKHEILQDYQQKMRGTLDAILERCKGYGSALTDHQYTTLQNAVNTSVIKVK